MKKILILIILLLSLTAFLSIRFQITGHSISPSEHSYTRAMCDENNYCQDYKIDCYNGRIIRIQQIIGASVQHLPEWKDPRENTSIEDLCKTNSDN